LALYENVFLNEDPDFKNESNNQLIIGDDSGANGKGIISVPTLFTMDIIGVTRTNPSDLGAYQHITFED
jgi:hypothetical protein